MLKHLAIFAVAVFVLAAAPSVQAAPAAGLLSLKTSQSVVEPVYWRYHHYRYWRHRVYWRHPYYWRRYYYWRHPVYYRHYGYWGPTYHRYGWFW